MTSGKYIKTAGTPTLLQINNSGIVVNGGIGGVSLSISALSSLANIDTSGNIKMITGNYIGTAGKTTLVQVNDAGLTVDGNVVSTFGVLVLVYR